MVATFGFGDLLLAIQLLQAITITKMESSLEEPIASWSTALSAIMEVMVLGSGKLQSTPKYTVALSTTMAIWVVTEDTVTAYMDKMPPCSRLSETMYYFTHMELEFISIVKVDLFRVFQ